MTAKPIWVLDKRGHGIKTAMAKIKDREVECARYRMSEYLKEVCPRANLN